MEYREDLRVPSPPSRRSKCYACVVSLHRLNKASDKLYASRTFFRLSCPIPFILQRATSLIHLKNPSGNPAEACLDVFLDAFIRRAMQQLRLIPSQCPRVRFYPNFHFGILIYCRSQRPLPLKL